MRAVALTGMPGAGKSLAVEVAAGLGIPVVRMGDAVWEEVGARGLPLTNEHVGKVASEMRERHGPGVWAERTIERIRKLNPPQVVIDGVRSLAEVEVFRARLGADFLLVAIHAAPRTRLKRLLARHRADDVKSEEEFRARDARELAWGIGSVIALADVVVENEGAPERLQGAVRAILKQG
jgi:dephospho-CoA kinase